MASARARTWPASCSTRSSRLICTRRRRPRSTACSATDRPSAEMSIETVVTGGGALTRPPLSRLPDRALRWVLTGLAAAILILIAYFFVQLIIESEPVFSKYGVVNFVFSNEWVPSQNQFGALPLVVGTLITSAIALVIGVP